MHDNNQSLIEKVKGRVTKSGWFNTILNPLRRANSSVDESPTLQQRDVTSTTPASRDSELKPLTEVTTSFAIENRENSHCGSQITYIGNKTPKSLLKDTSVLSRNSSFVQSSPNRSFSLKYEKMNKSTTSSARSKKLLQLLTNFRDPNCSVRSSEYSQKRTFLNQSENSSVEDISTPKRVRFNIPFEKTNDDEVASLKRPHIDGTSRFLSRPSNPKRSFNIKNSFEYSDDNFSFSKPAPIENKKEEENVTSSDPKNVPIMIPGFSVPISLVNFSYGELENSSEIEDLKEKTGKLEEKLLQSEDLGVLKDIEREMKQIVDKLKEMTSKEQTNVTSKWMEGILRECQLKIKFINLQDVKSQESTNFPAFITPPSANLYKDQPLPQPVSVIPQLPSVNSVFPQKPNEINFPLSAETSAPPKESDVSSSKFPTSTDLPSYQPLFAQKSDETTCPLCMINVPKTAKNCPACFTEINASTKEIQIPTTKSPEPTPAQPPTFQPLFPQKSDEVPCPMCMINVPKTANKCPACFTEINATEAETVTKSSDPVTATLPQLTPQLSSTSLFPVFGTSDVSSNKLTSLHQTSAVGNFSGVFGDSGFQLKNLAKLGSSTTVQSETLNPFNVDPSKLGSSTTVQSDTLNPFNVDPSKSLPIFSQSQNMISDIFDSAKRSFSSNTPAFTPFQPESTQSTSFGGFSFPTTENPPTLPEPGQNIFNFGSKTPDPPPIPSFFGNGKLFPPKDGEVKTENSLFSSTNPSTFVNPFSKTPNDSNNSLFAAVTPTSTFTFGSAQPDSFDAPTGLFAKSHDSVFSGFPNNQDKPSVFGSAMYTNNKEGENGPKINVNFENSNLFGAASNEQAKSGSFNFGENSSFSVSNSPSFGIGGANPFAKADMNNSGKGGKERSVFRAVRRLKQ